jgi:hypothetical protein
VAQPAGLSANFDPAERDGFRRAEQSPVLKSADARRFHRIAGLMIRRDEQAKQ